MNATTVGGPDSTLADTPADIVEAAPGPPSRGSWWRRLWRRPLARWLAALVLVLLLVLVTVAVFWRASDSQNADDPRSTRPSGTAALAQLLKDEGVAVITTSTAAEAVSKSDLASTLVVANPDRLNQSDARMLAQSSHGRLVLLRADTLALDVFNLPVTAQSPATGQLEPGCADPDTVRAGRIVMDDMRASYEPTGPATLACFPTGQAHGYVRVGVGTASVDLVAGGLSNHTLGGEGNAAFAMALLGSQPKVVWLMPAAQSADGAPAPTLLPSWWEMAAVQLALALVVIGIWRGRRLGPILTEPLPVRVRASETVEGHGRLYFRLGARDRAAEALRAAARDRLGRAFGHGGDSDQLAEVLAARTGRDRRQVQVLLAGPPPVADADLTNLADDLDQLEQEARRL